MQGAPQNFAPQNSQNVQFITVSNSPSQQPTQSMVQSPMPSQVVQSPQGATFTQSPSGTQGPPSNFNHSPQQGSSFQTQNSAQNRNFSSQCPISNSEFLQSQPSTVQVASHNNPQDRNYFSPQQPTHINNMSHQQQHRQQPMQGQSMNYQVNTKVNWVQADLFNMIISNIWTMIYRGTVRP